jgi:hypothetical protein
MNQSMNERNPSENKAKVSIILIEEHYLRNNQIALKIRALNNTTSRTDRIGSDLSGTFVSIRQNIIGLDPIRSDSARLGSTLLDSTQLSFTSRSIKQALTVAKRAVFNIVVGT